jgi:hypothetical protein
MWKTVEVDVNFSDLDDEDLIEALEDRGYVVDKVIDSFGRRPKESEEDDSIQEIYQAMKFGKPYDELVRKFVMDRTGRIL